LDEYEINGVLKKNKFYGAVYQKTIESMLVLIKKVEDHAVHGPKFLAQRKLWANMGMYVFFKKRFLYFYCVSRSALNPEIGDMDEDLDVDLD
jgi:hypothetical protein